jgi:thiamine transport system ATP-binding protein
VSLELRNVTVDYGSKRAVDAVSINVEVGSVLALVGPSGCGKSSLLRAIAGLVPLAGGQVSWDGEDLTHTPTEQRDLGFMFQDHALFTHRNVEDNVAFGLRMQGVPARERSARVRELLALVGLDGFESRAVEGLSGGEAQRVALARALAPSPRILLLDEPLASLDRARRDELNDELSGLLRELGQTAIYVTHDQDEAFAIADEVGVMSAGELVRVGTPSAVWSDPRTEFVARFVGHETIVERDGRRFAVRDDAIQFADASQGVVASVVTCRFQGDRHRVVAKDEDGTRWSGWSLDPIAIGDRVGVVIDAARLAPLE